MQSWILEIENIALLNTWTEYCEDLYYCKIGPDNILKKNTMNNNEEQLPLECEVRDVILTLKNGKSPSLDNIPSELLKHWGESLIEIFTTSCQHIWKTKKWPDQWTKSLIIQKKWLMKMFKLPSSKPNTTCKQDTSKTNIKPTTPVSWINPSRRTYRLA